jgi:hypothetical protein
VDLPIWFKANFRGHVLWAVNEDHLLHLERVIQATLRERPVFKSEKLKFKQRRMTNQNMPFNLPTWLLSAKNRPALIRLVAKMKKTGPQTREGRALLRRLNQSAI